MKVSHPDGHLLDEISLTTKLRNDYPGGQMPRRADLKKVTVIGSGPIVIGLAARMGMRALQNGDDVAGFGDPALQRDDVDRASKERGCRDAAT